MDVLITDRLLLTHLTLQDAPFIFELLNTPEWLQFIGDRNIRTLEDARKYLISGPLKSYEVNGFGLYAVKLKTNRNAIGLCGIIKRPSLDHADIGFAFLPDYTGKGFAREAAAATLHFAQTTLGLQKVLAITNEKNLRSQRLLEKIGLHFERKIIFDSGEELMLYTTPVASANPT